jgi:hypothetical protein
MCETGGSWNQGIINPVARFKLRAVEAITHSPARYIGYDDLLKRTSALRKTGMSLLNPANSQLTRSQLCVLDALRSQFHERPPGTDPRCVNTFYSFLGCKWDYVESICLHDVVNARAKDAGFFGSGFYTSLNIEYAARYAKGQFDPTGEPRATRDGCVPVIMFACFVSMAYPITRADYRVVDGVVSGSCDYYGQPLKTGYDAHVICVNEASGFQAVERTECQYVEVVIEQKSQVLPVAVLWLEI